MKTCFVVCPIGEENSETRKRSDQVLKHILSPICKDKGYDLIRSDTIHDTDKIDQTIIDQLNAANLVIADLSECNPNVFFEIGYRSALAKPLIQIANEGQELPFDVSSIRTIYYNLTDLDKVSACTQRLAETISIIDPGSPTTDNETTASTPPAQNVNIQIISLLAEIRDMIIDLQAMTNESNAKVVEQLINAFAGQIKASSTPQDRAAEMFLGELMKNPNKAMSTLNKLSKFNFPNKS